jgi:hypothetical protein
MRDQITPAEGFEGLFLHGEVQRAKLVLAIAEERYQAFNARLSKKYKADKDDEINLMTRELKRAPRGEAGAVFDFAEPTE